MSLGGKDAGSSSMSLGKDPDPTSSQTAVASAPLAPQLHGEAGRAGTSWWLRELFHPQRFSNTSLSDAAGPGGPGGPGVPVAIPESPEESQKFDPLIWLSERLKKNATEDQSALRPKIKERVIQQIKALEAAEEAERQRLAEAEAAARADDGEITSIAEAPGDAS
eukprot:Skav216707  [mRNA]  locus=scaffold91:571803:576992:+ [translate_table: standard]